MQLKYKCFTVVVESTSTGDTLPYELIRLAASNVSYLPAKVTTEEAVNSVAL